MPGGPPLREPGRERPGAPTGTRQTTVLGRSMALSACSERDTKGVALRTSCEKLFTEATLLWVLSSYAGRLTSECRYDHGRFRHESSVAPNCPCTRFTAYSLCRWHCSY